MSTVNANPRVVVGLRGLGTRVVMRKLGERERERKEESGVGRRVLGPGYKIVTEVGRFGAPGRKKYTDSFQVFFFFFFFFFCGSPLI